MTVWRLTGLAIYSYQSDKSLNLLQLLKSCLIAMSGQVRVDSKNREALRWLGCYV